MNDTQKEKFLNSQIWKLYPDTATHEPKNTDIILEQDNYICIYERNHISNNIDNIIFLATSHQHKLSLLDNVKYFAYMLIYRYGVRVATMKNKKWKVILDRIYNIELAYEKEEYMIYAVK